MRVSWLVVTGGSVSRGRSTSPQAVTISWATHGLGLSKGGRTGGGRKWVDLRFMLEIEPTGLDSGFVRRETRRDLIPGLQC